VAGEVDHVALVDRALEPIGEDEFGREGSVRAEAGESRKEVRLGARLRGDAVGAAPEPLAHARDGLASADDAHANLVRRERAARVEWAVLGQPEPDINVPAGAELELRLVQEAGAHGAAGDRRISAKRSHAANSLPSPSSASGSAGRLRALSSQSWSLTPTGSSNEPKSPNSRCS
jgi:hypothetical protein